MNHPWWFILGLCCLLTLLFLPACTPNGASTPTPTGTQLTAAQVKENYPALEGQMVSMRGYGVVMETLPLCPGYEGMDTRLMFVDEENNTIYAVVNASAPGAERSDNVREFQVYVRVFDGEIGCPGSLQIRTFPYLEIVAIK